ncbi:MAG: hypothetical protein FWD23_19285 [Oscillospiraceae bacterium]|nr:hypothetical protein [Oscillospiraceae bacterium]
MKKLSRLLAVVLILIFVLNISVLAYYDGDKDQYRYNVPKVNDGNPAIKIDGTVDIEGEWAGALKVTFDITKENTELTVWDSGVWGGDGSIGEWGEIAASSRLIWDYYIMWANDGLYIGIVCENDPTSPGPLDVAAYLGDDYDGNKMTDRHSIEIVPSDDFDGLDNSAGNMYWYYFWSETSEPNFWLEGQTSGGWDSFQNNPKNLGVKTASKRASAANAQGYYPYNIEIFIPWEGLKFDTDGNPGQWDFTAQEGWTFMMGMIAEDRTGNTDEQIRVTNGKSWWNYDFFKLAGPVATLAAAVEESAEEVAEEVPAPAAVAPAPAPKTGDTFYMIIILLVLVSGSAVVLKKSQKQR